ncbi:hypothetical protein KPH14_011654 [Odynerus spinipes]|uniref:CCHC-type domain-containing protein n=1 Tax=Odynerus spinipes TaxID=1348599 RepID=A0AAD9REG9_9HYME|nr:hypothetical protein KPH14_011654 [Odynerus spinipes]
MAESLRIGIAKLNNENYSVWKFKVELMLIKEDLWDQVSMAKPEDQQAAAIWQKKDDKARATIGLLVEDSQLVHIRKASTAKQVWESLQNYHEKSTLTSKVYLFRQICKMHLSETGNMEAHVATMQELVDKLTALGEEIKDPFFVAMLLSSLPDSYGTMITALESRPEEELTLSFVKGKLIDEYKRRKGVPEIEDSTSALRVSQKKTVSTDKGRGRSCYFCHRQGHSKADCYKYKKWKENKEKTDKIERADKAKENKDHTRQRDKEDDRKMEDFCFNVHESQGNTSVWLIDSGATSHMTNYKNFFDKLEYRNLQKVTVANGKNAEIVGIGSGRLSFIDENNSEVDIMLNDVLYVPELTDSLLSVKKLVDMDLEILFKESACRIFKGNAVIATINASSNMYPLRLKHKAMTIKKKTHTEQCQHTWHRRFGHRNPVDI